MPIKFAVKIVRLKVYMTIASLMTLTFNDYSRSEVCLKLEHYLNYYIHKLGTRVDLWMPYMLMLVLMTLTLMQGHSTSAKATNQLCMLSSTKQAISIKLATEVGGGFFM